MTYDHREGETLHRRRILTIGRTGQRSALLLAAVAIGTLACRPQPPRAEGGESCVPGARFSGELYGELAAGIDWRGAELDCEGMPRPFDAGARLRFAGPAGSGERRLAFIVALPDLAPGATENELRATVTVIEEDNGRFFSNGDNPGCWSDVTAQEALAGTAASVAVTGIVYCLTPLAGQHGNGSVRIGDIGYTGRIDWERED